MKKILHFTQFRIRGLPIPWKGRVEYYDEEKKNLMCRVSSTGYKSYAVVKWHGGKMQRVTIGDVGSTSVTEARNQVDTILTTINAGINPTVEKRKKEATAITLGKVLDKYISSRNLKPRTIEDYRYKVHHDLADWIDIPLSKITENMVIKKQRELSERGKTLANAAMRVLRLLLNYADAVGMIEGNPVLILSKAGLWHNNNRKDRVIPSTELKAWHEAVLALPNYKSQVYFMMLIYMGFRSSEALSLQWSNVDMKAKTITMIDTKNGTDHRLPIPIPLWSYIKSLHGMTGLSKWVFEGKDPVKAMTLPKKSITAIINASGVTFSPHDCRRTFATIAEAVNLPMSMIKRLMNHATTHDVTGGYIVTEKETLREAINKIADDIQARVTQPMRSD
ncbi:MAG: tyrosine-type recombinase/integrase [Methylophagaceae bacterium]